MPSGSDCDSISVVRLICCGVKIQLIAIADKSCSTVRVYSDSPNWFKVGA
jgi:hypothetical protein